MRYLLSFLISLLCVLTMTAQQAAPPESEVEARRDAIAKTLRCVVCQNQTIYESDAPLAADMRTLVETRVRAGDSDEAVRLYLRDRYGDVVLMRPPFQINTILLWLGPALLLSLALYWFLRRARQVPQLSQPSIMSEADRARVQAALKPGGEEEA